MTVTPASSAPAPLHIGLLVFPDMTQLDMTGPLQVLCAVPQFVPDRDVRVHLVWKTREPVTTDTVLTIAPTTTFAEAPDLDVLCIPGGYGTDALLEDDEVLDFVRVQSAQARYVTSVCTGALVLGAAGLLRGFRAATHWTAMDCLEDFGAIRTDARVVVDRNRVTGGGVTAGIDFALTLVSEMFGRRVAEQVQLRLEYVPSPPFDAGSPETAPADVVDDYLGLIADSRQRRRAVVGRAAARLSG